MTSPNPKLRFSLILLNYNEAKMTMRALRSIRNWSRPEEHDLEIIVVDNGGSKKINPRDLTTNEFHLDLPANVFFGEGNNIGAEHSSGEILIFANNDILVRSDFLEKFAKNFNSQDVGIVGSIFVNSHSEIIEAGGFIGSDGHPIRAFAGTPLSEFKIDDYSLEPDYVSAAFMAIRRDVFFDLGGFDLSYEPAYYEDTELCFSVKKEGFRLSLSDIVIEHNETYTNAKAKNRKITNGASEKGRLIFLSRWEEAI